MNVFLCSTIQAPDGFLVDPDNDTNEVVISFNCEMPYVPQMGMDISFRVSEDDFLFFRIVDLLYRPEKEDFMADGKLFDLDDYGASEFYDIIIGAGFEFHKDTLISPEISIKA